MKNKISFWFNNARPISLPQSLLPALTAVALSYGNSDLIKAVFVFLLVAGAAAGFVTAVRGWKILWWAAAAAVIGESYSGKPLKLGFHGLGELVIFLMFGPLLMTGVYYSITGGLDWKILWLSMAVGMLVTNIVYSHSVLDAVPDRKMGKKTMAHL